MIKLLQTAFRGAGHAVLGKSHCKSRVWTGVVLGKEQLKIIAILSLFLFSTSVAGDIEFSGTPQKKIEMGEKGEWSTILKAEEKGEYQVVITREGGSYFWTSRGGIEMAKVEAGAYVTYMAVNGSGYVRVVRPEMREMFSKLSNNEKKKAGFLYMEHLIHHLGSITYYGL